MDQGFRDRPVDAVEGIGPKAAERLAGVHIHAVADLLRFPLAHVHRAVHAQASLEQVRRWRAAAGLLQLPSMTPQWAEALVAAGLHTVARLAGADLDDVRAAFAAAERSGIIQGGPADGELVALFKQAVLHQHTGVLRGTVRDAQGRPLAGVEARCGDAVTRTDDNGRFDLLRLPLNSAASLVLSAPGAGPLHVEHPAICADPDRVGENVYRYVPGTTETPGGLSELSGQLLGRLAGRRVRSVKGEADALRENDILLLRRLDPDKGRCHLVSKLKSVIDDELRVHTFQLPPSCLPADAAPGDLYRVRNGEPDRIDAASFDLGRYRRWLVMRRVAADLPPADDEQSQIERVERSMDALFAGGMPARRFRR